MKRAKKVKYNQSMRYLMVLSLSVLLLGCSSIDVERVRALDKVAVPMITVNKYIDMGKFSLGKVVQRIVEDDKFDLQPALDNLHNKTYNNFATNLPFSLIDEKKLLSYDKYKNFEMFTNIDRESRYLLTPEGYMKYSPTFFTGALNKRSKILEAIPEEADAAMTVYVDYQFVKRNIPMIPVKMAAIKARVRMDIYNKKNERVLKIRENAESDEEIKAIAGVMTDTDKIRSMTLNATNKALEEADNFIQENL